MMHYLIILHDYSGIGGAQLYSNRRANYLIENGYSVSFLVTRYDDSKISKPEGVNIFYNNFLNVPTVCLSKKVIREELNKFLTTFGSLSNLIIETFSMEAATWGEIYAENLKCKHLIYCLGEPYVFQFRYRYFLSLFMFKYNRGELIGLSDCSLKIILGSYFREKDNFYVNISYDPKELGSKTYPFFLKDIQFDSFVIGTLSRLEKEYIPVLIESVIELANEYSSQHFSLLICGEGVLSGTTVEDYKLKYLKQSLPLNLELVFPGYTFPVGSDFFSALDVFVGMGTAAVSSISQKCATICVDPRVNKSTGVFGLDTYNFAYSYQGRYFRIKSSIEFLYLNRDKLELAQKLGQELFNSEFQNQSCMNKLDDFIRNSKSSKDYFIRDTRRFSHFVSVTLLLLTRATLSLKILVVIYKRMKLFKSKLV